MHACGTTTSPIHLAAPTESPNSTSFTRPLGGGGAFEVRSCGAGGRAARHEHQQVRASWAGAHKLVMHSDRGHALGAL